MFILAEGLLFLQFSDELQTDEHHADAGYTLLPANTDAIGIHVSGYG